MKLIPFCDVLRVWRGGVTFRGSYRPELPALITLGCGGSPPTGKLPGGPNLRGGPIGACSSPAFASRRVLTLSLDVISAKASLATTKFPDILMTKIRVINQ